MASPPPQERGDHGLRRGGAGGPPSRADRLAERGGLPTTKRSWWRSSGWCHRCPDAGVRPGALGAALEATRPRRRRLGRAQRRRPTAPARCGSRWRLAVAAAWRSRSRPSSGSTSTTRGAFYPLNGTSSRSRSSPRTSPGTGRSRVEPAWLAGAFALAAAVVNAFPFSPREADTQILTMIHLPIALWLAVGGPTSADGGGEARGGWISFASPASSSSTTS